MSSPTLTVSGNEEVKASTSAVSSSPTEAATQRPSRRACEPCRKLKIGCKGGNPCPSCEIRSRPCHYSVAASSGRPSKRRFTSLQHRVDTLEKQLADTRSGRAARTNITDASFDPQSSRHYLSPERQQYEPRQSHLENPPGVNVPTEDLHLFHFFSMHISSELQAKQDQILSNTLPNSLHRYTTNGDLFNDQILVVEPNGNAPLSAAELNWPSVEREKQLLQVYFDLVHPSFPILSPSIMAAQEWSALRRHFIQDPGWICIRLGLFILAAQHLPGEQGNRVRWWNARRRLSRIDAHVNLNVGEIQNLLLTCQIHGNMLAHDNVAWMTLGTAIRAMQSHNMDCEDSSSHCRAEVAHILRCLWWTAQSMNMDLCSSLGRIPSIVISSVLIPRYNSTTSTSLQHFQTRLLHLALLQKSIEQSLSSQDSSMNAIALQLEQLSAECHREPLVLQQEENDSSNVFAQAKLALLVDTSIAVLHRANQLQSLQFTVQNEPNSCHAIIPALQRSAKVCQSLLEQSSQEMILVDDEVALRALRLFTTACLLLCCTKEYAGRVERSDSILACAQVYLSVLRWHSSTSVFSAQTHAFASSLLLRLLDNDSNQGTSYSSVRNQSNAIVSILVDVRDNHAWKALLRSEISFLKGQLHQYEKEEDR